MFQHIQTFVAAAAASINYCGAVVRGESRALALTQELVTWYWQELDVIIATSGRMDTIRAKLVYMKRCRLLGRRFTAVCRARIRAEYGGEGK